MHLNPFAISNLLVFLTCFSLGIVAIFYGRTRLSIIYGLHAFSVCAWGLGGCLAVINSSPEISLFWWRVAYSAVIFIPILFLHTIFLLTPYYNIRILLLSYLQGIFFLILVINGNMFNGVKFMFNSFYYIEGGFIYFLSFAIWVLLVSLGHYLLIRFCIQNKDKQYLLFLVATSIGFLGGVFNFLPGFNINIYPVANFLIPFYSVVIAYAILKYQILSIKIIIQKGLIYSILIAIITATYFVFVFLAEKFFQGMVGYTSLIVSIIYAFVITLFFNPVKNKIQRFTDRVFLGKDPIQIAQENEFLRQELMRSEKLKAVAAFASGMAHEIKNPLTAIKTFVEYIPKRIEDKEFLGKFSKIVGSEVDKIDGLVHQLLDFSKPAPLQLKKTDVHKLIDETLELLNSQFIKYSIKVVRNFNANSRECNADVLLRQGFKGLSSEALAKEDGRKCQIGDNLRLIINVDPQRIKQVFLNLFLNAIEAMPNGGTLTVKTKIQDARSLMPDTRKKQASSIENQGSKVVKISVSDTGCGIPERDLPQIFEPFYSTKEKGSGLGLSIVYSIIKEHKGIISIDSKIGNGTDFVIELVNNEIE